MWPVNLFILHLFLCTLLLIVNIAVTILKRKVSTFSQLFDNAIFLVHLTAGNSELIVIFKNITFFFKLKRHVSILRTSSSVTEYLKKANYAYLIMTRWQKITYLSELQSV